jgi:hypothetical protein
VPGDEPRVGAACACRANESPGEADAQQGSMWVKADKDSFEVPPGVPYLWSLGEESESERTRIDRLQLFLPRDEFRDIASRLDAARGSVLDMPLGHLLGDFMLALEQRPPTPGELPALTNAVQAMIAAAVAPSPIATRCHVTGSLANPR